LPFPARTLVIPAEAETWQSCVEHRLRRLQSDRGHVLLAAFQAE
jgi:hypothetical protein